MSRTFTLEANGEFPFTFYIEKAVASEEGTEEEKNLIIEGVASTINVDHDNERMSPDALKAMANIINTKGVPLRVEHSKSQNAVIGSVYKAWVDERNQMHIRASLDKSHPVSPTLYHAMKVLGKKMGFSVGGLIKRAVREFSEGAGQMVKTFYDVELKEVSVTPRPANYDSWAVAKSIAKDAEEAEFLKSTFYDEFLFENPSLDYLQVFAKSVPEEAWRKKDAPHDNIKAMATATETEEKKSSETETEGTEKAVTRSEFSRAMDLIGKGFESMTKTVEIALRKMSDGTALDQRQPDKAKPTDESPTAKASETETETEKGMDVAPHDQNSPDKDKPKDESPAAKSESEGTDTEGTREKAKDTDDTYDMETVTRSISRLNKLRKDMETESETKEKKGKGTKKASETETKEKATETETETKATETEEETKATETETETEKGIHPIDQYVVTVTKTIEAMAAALKKGGKNVIGFEKAQVDRIVNDPEAQAAIREMLGVKGFKKSVSMGVPYMTTKDGKRYSLVAQEVGTSVIEKSRKQGDEKPSFKEAYKANFASFREDEA